MIHTFNLDIEREDEVLDLSVTAEVDDDELEPGDACSFNIIEVTCFGEPVKIEFTSDELNDIECMLSGLNSDFAIENQFLDF